MTAKSTPSPSPTRGRVFAVLRKLRPIKGKSSSKKATALVSKLMPMLTIGSTHIAAAAAQPPDVTSHDHSFSRGVREDLTAALTIAAPILGAVPIAGSPLKAAVDGLLEILKVVDTITRNRDDIKKLEGKLRQLDNDIFMVPVTQGFNKQRDDLTRQLNATLTKLKNLRGKRVLQYSTVAQTIKDCSSDIDYYLLHCTALNVMHTQVMMEAVFASVPQLMTSRITGIVLIDAAGKRRDVSMDCAMSYEMFTKIIAHFFDGNRMEARIQRRYIEQGRYDLCIDQGTKIVQINGERDWSKVEPGMQIVMRAILVREKENHTRKYQCPRCKTWNESEGESKEHSESLIIDCQGCDGRFQISEEDGKYTKDTSEDENGILHDTEMGVLVNFHLMEYEDRRMSAARRREAIIKAARMRRAIIAKLAQQASHSAS